MSPFPILITFCVILFLFCDAFSNDQLLRRCLDNQLYKHLREIFPLLKILLTSLSKFIIWNPRERVAVILIGMLLWYLIGLSSEIIIYNKTQRGDSKNGDDVNKRQHKDRNAYHARVEENDDKKEDDEDDDGEENNDEDDEMENDNKKEEKKNHQNYSPVDLLDGADKGQFFEEFCCDTDLFDDDVWKFHLCHGHGSGCRDLLCHAGWIILYSRGFCGMFDERREEGSLAFQFWRTYRMLFRKRAPIDAPTRHQMQRDMLLAIIKSKSWKNSSYIEDTTYHMPDILVDESMISLSPRLYPAMRYVFTKLQMYLQTTDEDWDWRDYFQFYRNGSFRCKFDSHRDAPRNTEYELRRNPPVVLTVRGDFDASVLDECGYEQWARKCRDIYDKTVQETKKNNGFHFRRQMKIPKKKKKKNKNKKKQQRRKKHNRKE